MTNKEINQTIEQLRKIEAQAAELKAAAEAVRDSLKAELDARQEDSISTGLHNIFYKLQEKTVTDTDKLKKAGLFDQFSKKSTSILFKITDIKIV